MLPTHLDLGDEREIKQVVCGINFTCMLMSDGKVLQTGATGAEKSQAEDNE